MAYVSTMRALAAAGLDPADVELIVIGTCSFDDQVPTRLRACKYGWARNAPRPTT